VTGGMDGKLKIWEEKEENSAEFRLVCEVGVHEDWVRDVSWCNNIGLNYDMIASCDENKRLKIYRNDPKSNNANQKWELVHD